MKRHVSAAILLIVSLLVATPAVQGQSESDHLASWSHTDAHIPPAVGKERARFNLWRRSGAAPDNGVEGEFVVRSFGFEPLP